MLKNMAKNQFKAIEKLFHLAFSIFKENGNMVYTKENTFHFPYSSNLVEYFLYRSHTMETI